jgi:hypothetical protein
VPDAERRRLGGNGDVEDKGRGGDGGRVGAEGEQDRQEQEPHRCEKATILPGDEKRGERAAVFTVLLFVFTLQQACC